MKKQNNISTLTQLAKQAAKIKISDKLNTVADTAFLRKKWRKVQKHLLLQVCLSKIFTQTFL
jgi:hypothetical protein